MQQLQFIGVTPETHAKSIIDGFKKELEQIKKDFQPKQPTEYLTRKEVADLLSINLATVHNWTKRGKLNPYGIGNRVYYKRTEVESALKPIGHEQ